MTWHMAPAVGDRVLQEQGRKRCGGLGPKQREDNGEKMLPPQPWSSSISPGGSREHLPVSAIPSMMCQGSGNVTWQVDVVIFWGLLASIAVVVGHPKYLQSRLTLMLFLTSLFISWPNPGNERSEPRLHLSADLGCPNLQTPPASGSCCSPWTCMDSRSMRLHPQQQGSDFPIGLAPICFLALFIAVCRNTQLHCSSFPQHRCHLVKELPF